MGSRIISLFNQFLTALILFLWSFVPHKITPPIITAPAAKLEASTSAVVTIPPPSVPWGTTEKLGEHQYRTFVANDPTMGTPSEILVALNVYRHNHNVQSVRDDENICKLAQMRADQQQKLGNLDGHQGLIDYMNDQSHWSYLNITAIGENASYGYILSGTHLIEWIFDSDVEHRDNQLNPNWNLACAAVSGVTVDIIFGQR